MWQRIQTIYLLLTLVFTIICLCSPVAFFHEPELGGTTLMINYFTVVPMAKKADFSVWPMFVVLLLFCPITIFSQYFIIRKGCYRLDYTFQPGSNPGTAAGPKHEKIYTMIRR